MRYGIVSCLVAVSVLAGCAPAAPSPTAAPAKPAATAAPQKPAAVAPAAAPAKHQVKSSASKLGIPPGHLPPPGQCRVWIPGDPPGHQAKPRSCSNIESSAPAGSRIIYRPIEDKKVVHVKVVDQYRPGIVVAVRVYDVASGSLLREE